ncbi:MAG: hypothetical protein ACRDVK_03240 [Acidimicrobiia bacterium]
MTRPVLILALLLVACGDIAATPTSTTVSATTSSRTSDPTTTALTDSTTTDPPVTTTTMAGPASEFPLVVSSSGLLGYHDGDHWVPGEAVFEVEGGEEYQVIDLGGVAGTATGSTLRICEPIQTPMIELDPPLPVGRNETGAIAITGATWDVVPRAVATAGTPPADLIAEATSFLANRGLSDPEPAVAQYLTFDLEGDGVEEELLVIRRIPEDLFGNADSYSLVMMRKMVDVEEATVVIEFSRGSADNAYVVSHAVTAFADLNGDDKMEIVVDGYYYEGSGTTAWEYVDDDLGIVAALSAGCGA